MIAIMLVMIFAIAYNVFSKVKDDGTQITGDEIPYPLISLTYDDGPGNNTLEIAEFLHREKISATFFVVGNYDAYGPSISAGYDDYEILDDLVRLGHRVANHTYNHPPNGIVDLDEDTIFYQLNENQKQIDPYINNEHYWLRVPGAQWDDEVAGIVRKYTEFDKLEGPFCWSFGVSDVDYKEKLKKSAKETADAYYNDFTIRRKGMGGIVLLHDMFKQEPTGNYSLELTTDLIPRLKQAGYIFVAPVLSFSNIKERSQPNDFSDARDWDTGVGYYGTIRLADINKDGKADVCGRNSDGIVCALSTGSSFGNVTTWLSNNMRDRDGWKPAQYSTTIQLADVDGDGRADLCGRGVGGMVVGLANDSGTGFHSLTPWSYVENGIADFSDARGWGTDVGYYGTIRLADINKDGKADVCGRNSDGIVCALSTGNSFEKATTWLSNNMRDMDDWKPAQYSTTIQLADVDGDGRADLCGRGIGGMVVGLANDSGTGFHPLTSWSYIENGIADFSNAKGWSIDAGYYGTIRLEDVNGDEMADVCGKNSGGIVCALSTGRSFAKATTWCNNNMRDIDGWKPAQYSTTIQLADVNGDGRADLCGRGVGGMVMGFAP